MTEIEFKELFKTYKEQLWECCSIARYKKIVPGSHFMLEGQFDKLSKEIHRTVTDNSSLEMFKPLKEFLDSIYIDYRRSSISQEQYGKKSAKQYKKIFDSLFDELHHLTGRIVQAPVAKSSAEFKKPVMSEYNKPLINKKQVLALMQLFREYKLVNKELTDTALAESFGTLTGYIGSQLRKDFSEFNKGEVLLRAEEIGTLKDILLKMSEDLSKFTLK